MLGYCRYSANPVGRLVLYLCGYRDAERQQLSDATCTALQLANFWQDVGRDLEKGRIYIPLESLAAHGLTEEDIVARRFDARYVSLMKELISRTRELFAQGMPLAASVDSTLRVDIEMFSRGGLAVLDAIEAGGYNTLQHRPSIPKSKQLGLLAARIVAARVCAGFCRCSDGARSYRRRLPLYLHPAPRRWKTDRRKTPPKSRAPTRNADASLANPPAISTTRSSCCRPPSAMRYALSTPSCA